MNECGQAKIKVEVVAAESSLSLRELLKKAEKLEGVQLFDPTSIACPLHIQLAFLHATKAFENKENISKSRKIEILLRAACTRQISKAIEIVGVKDPKNFLIGSIVPMHKVLKALAARRKRFVVEKERVAQLFGIDKKKLDEEIIDKMILAELE